MPPSLPLAAVTGLGLAVLLGIRPAATLAGTVYRCLLNGTVAFMQYPANPDCQPLEVKPYEPDPEEAARQREELKNWRDAQSQVRRESRQNRTPQQPATSNRKRGDADYRYPTDSDLDRVPPPATMDFNEPPDAGR